MIWFVCTIQDQNLDHFKTFVTFSTFLLNTGSVATQPKKSSSQSRISSADLLSCSRLADGIVAGRPVGQPPPSVAPPPPPPKTDGRRETSIKCHSEEEEDYSVKSLLFFLGEIALLFDSLISGTDDHELFLIIPVCLLVAKWRMGPQIGGESNRERRIGF